MLSNIWILLKMIFILDENCLFIRSGGKIYLIYLVAKVYIFFQIKNENNRYYCFERKYMGKGMYNLLFICVIIII